MIYTHNHITCTFKLYIYIAHKTDSCHHCVNNIKSNVITVKLRMKARAFIVFLRPSGEAFFQALGSLHKGVHCFGKYLNERPCLQEHLICERKRQGDTCLDLKNA